MCWGVTTTSNEAVSLISTWSMASSASSARGSWLKVPVSYRTMPRLATGRPTEAPQDEGLRGVLGRRGALRRLGLLLLLVLGRGGGNRSLAAHPLGERPAPREHEKCHRRGDEEEQDEEIRRFADRPPRVAVLDRELEAARLRVVPCSVQRGHADRVLAVFERPRVESVLEVPRRRVEDEDDGLAVERSRHGGEPRALAPQ